MLQGESIWNIIDVIINALQLLTVCLPAIFFFVYYRFSVIEIWEKNVSVYGTTLYIHNKTKRSIYISKLAVEYNNTHNWKKCPEIDFEPIVLKGDEYKDIVINYSTNPYQIVAFTVKIYYNRHYRKRIKIYVQN